MTFIFFTIIRIVLNIETQLLRVLFRYYEYTVSRNGKPEQHGNSFEQDYYTDLIKNDTVKFIKDQNNTVDPLFMIIAPPAPHQPWDADPKYKSMFDNINAKDYVDSKQYNVHKGDGHWLLRSAPTPMSDNRYI